MSGLPDQYIADRYRIEEQLGRGGMAAVYRVFDEATHKESALKLLNKDASESGHLSSLFEREFHTLAQLAHPRIIEVYDFGVDTQGAYYTMELLDGADLRTLAPLDWKQACALLRDVASSLALLHSRRLLHRDVSSRNVRCTRDGRAKLIDFGAMVAFGIPAKVIGTPAFVAPEALNHQPLDQRADLYALGALAYWLVTRRYAYRAHYLAHLHDAWRTQPIPLSVLNPEVPKPLNDLVMSLLNLDRMGRPFSAPAVVETLGACAGLAPDDTLEVKQSYLTTPQLEGRAQVVTELRKRMLMMFAGQPGDTLLLEGPSGIGRSRLLAELALEGKVIGATVLSARAEASSRVRYAVVWELIEQLFENAHDAAVEAIKGQEEVLNGAFPGLTRLMLSRRPSLTDETFGPSTFRTDTNDGLEAGSGGNIIGVSHAPSLNPSVAADSGAGRIQVQKALLDLFLKAGRLRRLVIAVDDFHRVDEPSAALLSALALEISEHVFVLAVTAESGAAATAPAAYGLLSRTARRVEVCALDVDATERLLRSIFGETANLRFLADRVYGISKGNPRAIMQLAQHLVDKGVVRYQSGTWILPASIDAGDLPSSLSEAFRAKARKLSNGALGIAQTMALSAERRFLFEECLLLAGHGDRARLTQALNELVASEVLVADGQYFAVSQMGWVAALTEGLEEESVRASHLRLAQAFEQRGTELLSVVQHLLRAGHSESALDTYLKVYRSIRDGLSQDALVEAEYAQSLPREWVQIVEELIDICRRLGRPKEQIYLLQNSILAHGGVTSTQTQTHLTEIIARLYRDSGLAFYYELGDTVAAGDRLWRALEMAQQRYDSIPESERVLPPAEAIRALAQTVISAIRVIGTSFDYSLAESLPSLTPFIPLSSPLSIVEKNARSTRYLVASDMERARQGYLETLERIAEPDHAGMDESYYENARLAIITAIGSIEASQGIGTALKWIDPLDAHPLFQVNAWRIRLIYFLRNGDIDNAEQCKKVLELLQIQNSPSQFFEGSLLYPVLLAYGISDDLIGVGHAIEGIEEIAERFIAWVPILHYARGEYQRIRGDYASALVEIKSALSLIRPGRHIIWPYAAGAHIRTLSEMNRLEEAKTLGQEYLNAAENQDLGYIRHYIGLPLAIVEARLGNEDNGIKLSTAAIEQLRDLGATGITLGLAYETRARVAMYTDDSKGFRGYAKLCAEYYRAGQNPALTAKYQKMTQEARRILLGTSQEFLQSSDLAASLSEGGRWVANVHAHLAKYTNYQDRVAEALNLIIQLTRSSEGYLYLLEADELKLVSQQSDQPPPEMAVQTMREMVSTFSEEKSESETTETQPGQGIWQSIVSEDRAVAPVVLSANVNGETVKVGAVLLSWKDTPQYRPDIGFYEAVSLCLYEGLRGANPG